MMDNGFWKVCEALDCMPRLKLLQYLILAEKTEFPCVSELAEAFRSSEPSISVHLKKLADAGLVMSKRADRCVYYRAFPSTSEGERVIAALHRFFADGPSEARIGLLQDYAHVLSHCRRSAVIRFLASSPVTSLKAISLGTDMPIATVSRILGVLDKARIVDLNLKVFPPAGEPERTLYALTLE